ncbi:putative Cas1p 10 TM acyl transferase domain-containing protein [Seiridium cardinale]
MPQDRRRPSLQQNGSTQEIPPALKGLTTVFFWITIVALAYVSYIQRHDPYHCRALVSDGAWPSQSTTDPDQDFAKWEPHSCRMIEYSRDSFHNCLGGRRVIFAGDSTVRQIYWAAATRLDHEKAHVALLDVVVDDSQHSNLLFEAEGVKLEFIWDPWLNSSHLHRELTRFRVQETFADSGAVRSKDEESPALVVLGAPGLWAARHGADDYFDIFKRGIEDIRIHLSSYLGETLVTPTKDSRRNYDLAPNQIILAPVQVPWYESLSAERAKTITPERVDKMNSFLAGLSKEEQSHVLWAYHQMTATEASAFETNGIHVVERVAERKIDLALNARCNAARGHDIPHEATCCMKYPKHNMVQIAFYAAPAFLMLFSRFRKGMNSVFSFRSDNIPGVALFILLVLIYCDITDRGHKYLKLNRHYDATVFLASCLMFCLLSLSSWRTRGRSTGLQADQSTRASSEPTEQADEGFLSRDQTDEWKGWMQGLILIYHYNYASQTLWVYKLVRLLVSSYIFLSGYGHTTYLLRTEDYSLRRVAAVIFRLNFLSAILPYMMATDYNFYYFAPLITFWYLVVFLTLGVCRRYNQDPVLLLVKIVVAAIVTSCLILVPQPLQLLSTICRTIFHMHWDSTEIRFRLTVDRYIVFFGMITASIADRMRILRARQSITSWQQQQTNPVLGRPSLLDPALSVLEFPDALTKPIKPLACAFSALFILFFTVVTQTQLHDKWQYNVGHPYMSWIPVLSFLVLRNSHKRLRNSYMAIPAALGKISLETYILQYHIWLGGDATSKLRLSIWDRYGGPSWLAGPGQLLEILLISGFFICVSAYVRYATEILTKWLFYGGSPSVSHGFAESSPEMTGKERSHEKGSGRIFSGTTGHWESKGEVGHDQYRTGLLSRLRYLTANEAGGKVLVMLVVLWVGNLIYS